MSSVVSPRWRAVFCAMITTTMLGAVIDCTNATNTVAAITLDGCARARASQLAHRTQTQTQHGTLDQWLVADAKERHDERQDDGRHDHQSACAKLASRLIRWLLVDSFVG